MTPFKNWLLALYFVMIVFIVIFLGNFNRRITAMERKLGMPEDRLQYQKDK